MFIHVLVFVVQVGTRMCMPVLIYVCLCAQRSIGVCAHTETTDILVETLPCHITLWQWSILLLRFERRSYVILSSKLVLTKQEDDGLGEKERGHREESKEQNPSIGRKGSGGRNNSRKWKWGSWDEGQFNEVKWRTKDNTMKTMLYPQVRHWASFQNFLTCLSHDKLCTNI